MPSSGGVAAAVDREDEEKLDAALAIAALSGGLWTERTPSAGGGGGGRVTPRTAKRMRSSSSSIERMANGVKKRTRLKQTDPVNHSTTPSTSAVSKQTEADDGCVQGIFVRSAMQTAVIDGIGQPLPSTPLDTSSMKHSRNPVNLLENKTAEENQTGKCMYLQLLPLTSLATSGIFISQSNDPQDSSFDTSIGPQFMLMPTLQSHTATDNFNCLNSSSHSIQSTLNRSNNERFNPTSSDPTPQLPGSLSTLRDYYINVSLTSEAANNNMPSSTSLDAMPRIMSTSNAQQTLVFNIEEEATERISSKMDAESHIMNLSLPQGIDNGCTEAKVIVGKRSLSGTSSGDSNSSESGVVKMPGSLSILQKYYSSLGQKSNSRQTASLLPRTSSDLLFTLGNSDDRMAVSDEVALNLSKQYLTNDHKEKLLISEIDDCSLTIGIQQNPAILVSSDREMQSDSHCQTGVSKSSSPLRILPKIKETSELSYLSSHSGESHQLVKQMDSSISENSVCPSILPPKKRKPCNTSQMQLNNLSVLIGDEIVPLEEFVSRLNGNGHHHSQTIDLVQLGNPYEQSLASSPSSTSSLFMSSVLASGIQLVENQLDSLSSFSVNDFNGGPLLFDGGPEICATPFANSVLLTEDSMQNNANAAINTCIPSIHEKKSHFDQHTNEKSLPESPVLLPSSKTSHPILQPDDDGDLPLHIAVAQGKRDIVRHLTQMMNQLNATIDCRNNNRQTPLHVGVVTGDCEIVEILLNAGASPNIADRKGQNCFHLAVQYQHLSCLQRLFECCSESQPDIMNYEGMTALHLAVKLNQTEAVAVLLNNGAQPNITDGKSGHTPLFIAADTNRLRAAEILLASGASTQIPSYSGCSPVQAASAKSFHEMVKLLAKHGATTSEQISSETVNNSEKGK